jgi:AmiR/NasT family two-component response regulator
MKRGLRIALADDEAFIRRYFQDVLPDMGHEVVVVAENGRQLVERCRDTDPDLVVSDIRMPEMDGIDAALAICQHKPTPIVLVSAFHDEDLIARAEISQVMAYLIKPIGVGDLETTIAIAYRRFQQIRSLEEESAKLRQSLEDRKIIERAKGLLMKTTGWDEEESFRRMQQLACDRNEKLAEIARQILSAGPVLGMLHRER